jgi:predicted aconitase with swiveling domain
MIFQGRKIYPGKVTGEALVTTMGISFFGGIDPDRLKHQGHAPAAIVNIECETITAVGCIIAEIPCVDMIPIHQIKTGATITVDGEMGIVDVIE